MSENEMNDQVSNTPENEAPHVVDTQIPDKVTCTAAKDPSVRVFILAAMCIGFGAWCFMDRLNHAKPEIWDLKHINDIFGYYLNNFGYWVLIPLGLIILFMAIRMLKRVLIADQVGIGYTGKEQFKWADYSGMDTSKLKDKGILTVNFGEDRKILLDSWKLNNFKDLVAFVENKVQ